MRRVVTHKRHATRHFAEYVAMGLAKVVGPYGVWSIVAAGFLSRLLLLPISIIGSKAVLRYACAFPELHQAYLDYKAVEEHPRAVIWEKKVAFEQLRRDRERVLQAHNTGFVLTLIPPSLVVATVGCLSLVVLPVLSPLVGASDLGVDELLLLAATSVSFINVYHSAQRRKGLGDVNDRKMERAMKHVGCLYGALLFGSVTSSLVIGAPLFPCFIGAFLSGASMAGTLHNLLLSASLTKLILGVPSLPEPHGTYGPGSISGSLMDLYGGKDTTKSHEDWKREYDKCLLFLESDCDFRIHSMVKQLGLLDDQRDYERVQVEKKIQIVREREAIRSDCNNSKASGS